jgi:hypothetical protein
MASIEILLSLVLCANGQTDSQAMIVFSESIRAAATKRHDDTTQTGQDESNGIAESSLSRFGSRCGQD